MPYMYILECADGSYYTGSTWDLQRRLWEHQNGLGANHTAKHLPVKLVYCEECERIEDTYRREKQIQGWSRKKKQALMAGDTNMLHRLAECRNASHCRNVGFDSAQPTGLDSAQPTGLDSAQPTGLDSAQPTGLDSTQPTGLDSAQPTGLDSTQPTGLDSAQPMALGFDQPPNRSLSGVEGNIGNDNSHKRTNK